MADEPADAAPAVTWKAFQRRPNDDADLSGGEHAFQVDEPTAVSLVYRGDVVGSATLHPDGTMTGSVYEPNLGNRLAGSTGLKFSISAGTAPTDLAELRVDE